MTHLVHYFWKRNIFLALEEHELYKKFGRDLGELTSYPFLVARN